jgi:hypothetical protein
MEAAADLPCKPQCVKGRSGDLGILTRDGSEVKHILLRKSCRRNLNQTAPVKYIRLAHGRQ